MLAAFGGGARSLRHAPEPGPRHAPGAARRVARPRPRTHRADLPDHGEAVRRSGRPVGAVPAGPHGSPRAAVVGQNLSRMLTDDLPPARLPRPLDPVEIRVLGALLEKQQA